VRGTKYRRGYDISERLFLAIPSLFIRDSGLPGLKSQYFCRTTLVPYPAPGTLEHQTDMISLFFFRSTPKTSAFFRAAIIFPVVYAFAVPLVLHESQPVPFCSVMMPVRAAAAT